MALNHHEIRQRVAGEDDGGQPMPAAVAIGQMCLRAADRACGWPLTGPSHIIQTALDALLAGVDSPSLPLLAGLGRNEQGEAGELFDMVMDELGLVPLTPENLAAARWTMARWWAGRIVAGSLDPVDGADLIWQEAACELGHPAELQTFVRVSRELVDDLGDVLPAGQEQLDEILAAARQLLELPHGEPEHPHRDSVDQLG